MKRKSFLLILYLVVVSLGFARLVQRSVRAASNPPLKEAPAAFATPLLAQNPGSQSVSNGIPEPPNDTFALDQANFEAREGNDTGLGPVYNATSCADCHQNPVTGGPSQVTELRAGHLDANGNFVNPTITINDGHDTITGRSIVNDRAICPQAQEHLPATENIRALRSALNLLGDGFVEAVDDQTLINIAAQQPILTNGQIHGETVMVNILEAPGTTRVGRFGWKDQHGSLLSFAADAYSNEIGISNSLRPTDATTVCKTTTDPEDKQDNIGLFGIDHFTQFIRGTQAPPRDPNLVGTKEVSEGESLFEQVQCSICHVDKMTTVPPGTVLNGGMYTVSDAVGSKIIHPYSDFLLHDIGTGDGIVQGGPQDTQQKLRTQVLWGLRTKARFMHDLKSESLQKAIQRHAGEAAGSVSQFNALTQQQRNKVLVFLSSL